MKKLFTLILLTACLSHGWSQMKYIGEPSNKVTKPAIDIVKLPQHRSSPRPLPPVNGSLQSFTPLHLHAVNASDGIDMVFDDRETPVAIYEQKGLAPAFDATRNMQSLTQYLNTRAEVLGLSDPAAELKLSTSSTDRMGNSHFRYQQQYQGIDIYGAQMVVHASRIAFTSITGRWYSTPTYEMPGLTVPESEIDFKVRADFNCSEHAGIAGILIPAKQIQIRKVLYPVDACGEMILAYHVEAFPNAAEHWHIFYNAVTGEEFRRYLDICRMDHSASSSSSSPSSSSHCNHDLHHHHTPMIMDGDVTANAQDLGGSQRLIHNYQVGSNYYMIDASKPMYDAVQSNMPDEPSGVLWTLDAGGTSPQNEDFSVSHVHSTNNTWTPLEVSAHWNSTKAYEYFVNTHGRNSINGSGGNIISLINVRDENGNEMDNAFWNGYAMFYGNGDFQFQELARGLDVAGHEMSHGVIQNTANLEYVGQSGALNESFADVFGAMIDREDWKLGEDVVNTSVFAPGALRDLSNPHNGGNDNNDPGWQPAHMNEYVNLPNTPEGDNGGVHVNSGIVNKAFFNFASQVGKDVAEDVYYHALSNYLVKSSQFIDARIAVISAAEDLFPSQPNIATAAGNAFSMVGIGAGQGGSYEEDIQTNPGFDFVLLTDNDLSQLYVYFPANGQVHDIFAPAPLSRPSISDDGSIAVYVDQNQHLKAILFDWSEGTLDYDVIDLESNPQSIWRNIVISKDGSRIAFLTDDLDDQLYVYSFDTEEEQAFTLYNPTSGSGVSTGGVLYADVMEWDYSGEYIMYDALNEIDGTFGDGIRYWDISFIRVWNNAQGDFSFGQVDKLFTSLPENVSVGNATFSKNSPHIIAFDYVESLEDIFGNEESYYQILTANLESGRVVSVFENDVLGYPSYSRLDHVILFDSKNPDNQAFVLTAYIEMQPGDKMSPVPGTEEILITGGHFAVWAATGERKLTDIKDITDQAFIQISPNPASETLAVSLPGYTGEATLSLFDNTGHLTLERAVNVVDGQIDVLNVSSLTPGMYVLKVRTGDVEFVPVRIIRQ